MEHLIALIFGCPRLGVDINLEYDILWWLIGMKEQSRGIKQIRDVESWR